MGSYAPSRGFFLLLIVLLVVGCTSVETNSEKRTKSQSSSTESNLDTILNQEKPSTMGEKTIETTFLRRGKIVLLIDSSLTSELSSELEQYQTDIKNELPVEIKVISGDYSSPKEVKNALNQEREKGDFDGVVIIGDIPWPLVSVRDLSTAKPFAPSDQWYVDLEGKNSFTWYKDSECLIDSTCNTEYLNFTDPSEQPVDRWIARITPPEERTGKVRLLREYFKRNHAFRTGKTSHEGFLLFAPDSSLNDCQGHTCVTIDKSLGVASELATADSTVLLHTSVNEGDLLSQYKEETTKPYLYQIINVHGSPSTISIPEKGSLTASNLIPKGQNSLVTEFFSCQVGRFSDENDIATSYLFDGEGLAVSAAGITVMSGDILNVGNNAYPVRSAAVLGAGGRFFEAYPGSRYMYLLGDPTLQVKPRSDECRLEISKEVSFGMLDPAFAETTPTSVSGYANISVSNVGTSVCHLRNSDPQFSVVTNQKGEKYAVSFSLGVIPSSGQVWWGDPSIQPGEALDMTVSVHVDKQAFLLEKATKVEVPLEIVADSTQIIHLVDASVTLVPYEEKAQSDIPEAPKIGNSNAEYKLSFWVDFEDQFSGNLYNEVIKPLIDGSVENGEVQIIHQNYPLELMHPNSQKAAEAARCAFEQDETKFWLLYEKMFENQNKLDVESLLSYSGEVGLNQAIFNECLESGMKASEVANEKKEGERVGIRGTPSLITDGALHTGLVLIKNYLQTEGLI